MKPFRRLLAALTLAIATAAGLALNLANTPGDTTWGAPGTTDDTSWGAPPTETATNVDVTVPDVSPLDTSRG